MRETTKNEYHKSLNKVVDYINSHLKNDIDLTVLAEIANISEFHFHRIFKAFIGESVGSYILRLRLEKAAQKLQTTNLTLTDIAERTGYTNQYALSKAFKRHFGVTPSAFKNIRNYFSSQFNKPDAEFVELVPDIREVGPKKLIYIRIIAKYGSEKEYNIAWKKLWKFAKEKQIVNGQNEFIGLSYDDPGITQQDRCRFYACITTDKKIKPEGEFGTIAVPGGKYAVFTLKGSYSGLGRLYDAIYCQWLPQNSIKLRSSMPFEKYVNNPDIVEEQDLLTEIFIPVK